MRKFNTKKPWQAALITATALCAVGFYAILLSQSGHSEWAFLLVFGATWCLIALFWVNDEFIEESGMLLAEAVDMNIEMLHNRLVSLEKELAQLRAQGPATPTQSTRLPRLPVSKHMLV
jgi:hypothetical protein